MSFAAARAAVRAPRRIPVAAAAALVALLVGGVLASAADADRAGAALHTAGPYVAARPTCAQSTDPTAFRCFAEKLVAVPAGSPGAVPRRLVVTGHGPGGGLSPKDLATVYGYNRNGGSGQTVGIVIWGHNPYAKADLYDFEHYYKLPRETASSFRIVNEHGKSGPLPSSDDALTGTYGEIDLDVQTVRAVCAKCKIVLVEASVDSHGAPSDTSMANAEHTAARLGATVINNSWGGPESQYSTGGVLARAFKLPGVVITAATGDDGWYGWDPAQDGADPDDAVSFPASSPYVVSVGGTSVSVANGTATEHVWDGDGASADQRDGGASGGGCSTRWPAPLWQRTMPGYSAAGCRNHRLSADIAADGDPATGLSIFSHSDGGWGRYGGTSLATPIISGMYALAGGSGGSAYPAASLYVNLQHGQKPSSRYDVTSGGTGFCGPDQPQTCAQSVAAQSGGWSNNPNYFMGTAADCSFPHKSPVPRIVAVPSARSSECNAAAGFDGPTGIGSPRGLALFGNTAPASGISGSHSVKVHHSGSWTASVTAKAGSKITAIRWYFGDGSARSGARVTHSWSRKGTYQVGYNVSDSYGQIAQRHMTVKVS